MMADPALIPLPLADMDIVAVIAMMIPIVALLIPIVVILTAHQRKMAEIIHSGNKVAPGELDAIRQEIRELRSMMAQHTIALDDMRNKQSLAAPPDTVQQRLGS